MSDFDLGCIKFLINSCKCDYSLKTDSFDYDMFTDQLKRYFHHNSEENIRQSITYKPLSTEATFLAGKSNYMIKEMEILNILKKKLSLEKTEKVEKMFTLIDTNKDNFIDQGEFIKLIKVIDNSIAINDILSLYNGLDFNKDGKISYLEFFKALDIEDSEMKKIKLEKLKINLKDYDEKEKECFKLIVKNILR